MKKGSSAKQRPPSRTLSVDELVEKMEATCRVVNTMPAAPLPKGIKGGKPPTAEEIRIATEMLRKL